MLFPRFVLRSFDFFPAWLHLFRRITVGDLKVPDVAGRGDIEAIDGYNQPEFEDIRDMICIVFMIFEINILYNIMLLYILHIYIFSIYVLHTVFSARYTHVPGLSAQNIRRFQRFRLWESNE